MKTTSAKFKQILASKGAREYVIKIYLNLADGTALTLTEADIWSDTLSIDTASSGTSSLDIGTAVIGQCKFTLNNINGDYDDCDFFNAEATVWLGLKGDVSGSTQQYYRMGFFTVDEPSKANGLISLTLLDNMWLFDVPVAEAGVTFTDESTARSIINTMCSHVGVTLATQSFHGYDFPITSAPEDIDEMNCRELLQYIAMIGCNFCYIDDTGALNLSWYNTSATTSETVVFDLNQSTSFGTEDITITGVKFVIDDTDYTIGTSTYRLTLENPLVNADNVSSVLNSIWDILEGFTLRTFNITTASDLSAEIGDRCKIKDYKGNYIYSYITLNSFKLAAHLLQCNAVPPNRTLIKRYSKEVKAAVEVAREQSIQLISTYDQAVQRLNRLVEQSMGAFTDFDEAPNGGRIFYISNMPITHDEETGECVFEQGSIVFRMAGDVFSVSRDGGETWVNGYDPSTGELVVNVLNAIGINAEWIKTGTLTVGGSTSGTLHPTIEVYDINDTLICEINRNGITMHQGIISSPDYAETAESAPYSASGMKIDVLHKEIKSPDFALDSTGAYFRGEILITTDEEIGTNSFKFDPAEYNLHDEFNLRFQAAEGFVGTVGYTILRTNGTITVLEDSGTITDDTPTLSNYLDAPLANGYYYRVEVPNATTVTVSLEDATIAYVGTRGIEGKIKGELRGTVFSDYGNINGLHYGWVDNERIPSGVFRSYYSNTVFEIDALNYSATVGTSGGSLKARIELDEDGVIHFIGKGDSDHTCMRFRGGGTNDLFIRDNSNHGMTLIRDYPDGQGGYIEEEVVWDDGSFYKKANITYSTSDSPPASLADKCLFLVYEN